MNTVDPNKNVCAYCGAEIKRRRDMPRHQRSVKCLRAQTAPVLQPAPVRMARHDHTD